MASAKLNDDPTPNALEDASEGLEHHSVILKFPKFCNNFDMSDLIPPLKELICAQEIVGLGKLRHANHWQVAVKTLEARDKLLKRGSLVVKKKRCVIYPNEKNQLAGRLHWFPTEVTDNAIKTILQNFGEVVHLSRERVNPDNPDSPCSLVRFFVLNLDENSLIDDIPHVITIHEYQGLVIIKGRDPMCLRCKKVGHLSGDCPNKDAVYTTKNPKRKKKKLRCKKKSKSKVSANATSDLTEPNESPAAEASISVVPSIASRNTKKNETSTTKSNRNTASTSARALPVEQGAQAAQLRASKASTVQGVNEMVDDVKNLQDLMNVFSQKISEVLTDMGSTLHETVNKANARFPAVEGAASSSASNTQDGNKQGKKKKKKRKTSNHYDLTAAEAASNETLSSGQFSPKGSLDSGIALNGHSSSSTNTSVHVNEIQNLISKVGSINVQNCGEMSCENVGHMNASSSNQKKKKKNKKKSNASIPGLTHP